MATDTTPTTPIDWSVSGGELSDQALEALCDLLQPTLTKKQKMPTLATPAMKSTPPLERKADANN